MTSPSAQGGRGPVLERRQQELAQIGQQVHAGLGLGEERAPLAAAQASQPLEHVGEPEERIAERGEFPRGGASGRRAAGQALDVADALEGLAQAGAAAGVVHQHIDGVEALVDARRIGQRAQEPGAQQPRAHRRDGRVDRLEQGDAARAGAERLDELEVAAGHLVEPEVPVGAAHRGAGEVLEAAGLQLGEVAEQGAGGADGGVVGGAESEAVERGQVEAARQFLARQRGVELPALAGGAHHAVLEGQFRIGRRGHFRRRQAAERFGERLVRHRFEHELAGGQIDRCDADRPAAPLPRCSASRQAHRHQVVVPSPGQPPVFQQRAWRDGLDHLALDDPLGELRVLDLLADGHAQARAPTNWRRYSAAALTGTPASGMPSPRLVSVMSSSFAARSASSKNIS